MNYDKPQNEIEDLSADELKLREMCRSLKKTEAPHDFDFKLKARIASAKPAEFKPRFGFALRYAVPVLAVILVFGLLVFNGGFLSSNTPPALENPAISQNLPPPQNATASTAPTPETPNQNSAVLPPSQNLPKPSEVATINKAPKIREVKATSDSRIYPLGGSGLKAIKSAPVLNPRGFEQRVVTQNPQNNEQATSIPVKEILSTIGVNADLEDGKWKVKSVKANSIGEISNIKENDVIESIGNQPLSSETVLTKAVKDNTVTVTRGGEKLQIKLRGKQ